MPEERGHGGLEGRAEDELVQAHVAPGAGGQAVVVAHGQHQAAGEGMAVHPGDGGHGEGQEASPDRVQQRPEAVGAHGVAEVEAVGVELLDGRGGDDDAGLVAAELEDVEGREQRRQEGRRQAVVRRGAEAEDVDLGRGRGAGDGAADVGLEGRDGDGEEGICRHRAVFLSLLLPEEFSES